MEVKFNKLTPPQEERLYLIMEECAEVQHMIGKVLRHGYECTHPDDLSTTNRDLLSKEIGDLFGVIDFACPKDLNLHVLNDAHVHKMWNCAKYLHHNIVEVPPWKLN